MEHQAYISLDTGAIYWVSESNPMEAEADVPDDLETSDRYIAVPHKNDLDLGTQLALVDWIWLAVWLVSAVLEASKLAELSRLCLAELSPPVTSPPAIATGTLALTPFW